MMTPSQNRLRDRKLQNQIEGLAVPYRALVGSAVNSTYMEKSWAVMLERKVGIDLGLKFDQNAIYYVDAGKLSLVPCHLHMPETALGDFSARIKLVTELPEVLD